MAEVVTDEMLVRPDLTRCSGNQDFSFGKDIDPLDERQRLSPVVIGDQNPDSSVAQLQYQIADIPAYDRVDAGKWFIQKHIVRIGCQTAGNLHPPRFAARQRIRLYTAQMGNGKFIKKGIQFVQAAFPVRLAEFESRKYVVPDGHSPKDRCFLRQISKAKSGAPVHWKECHVDAIDEHSAGIRNQEARYRIEATGFSGAVASKDSHDLAATQTQVYVMNDASPPDEFGQALNEDSLSADGFHAVACAGSDALVLALHQRACVVDQPAQAGFHVVMKTPCGKLNLPCLYGYLTDKFDDSLN